MSAGFGFTRAANAQISEFTLSKDDARAVLSAYATDLSDEASQGKLESVQASKRKSTASSPTWRTDLQERRL